MVDLDRVDYEDARDRAMALLPEANLTPAELRTLLEAATEPLPEGSLASQVGAALAPGMVVQAINWPAMVDLLDLRRRQRDAAEG